MAQFPNRDSIDVHLLRVLNALLTEGSVSRAALKLNQSQPAMSTALRRLRELTGDPLLVRSKNGMTPTPRGASLLEPVRQALANIDAIVTPPKHFVPAETRRIYKLATPDYIAPELIGKIVGQLRLLAPHAQLQVHSMGADQDLSSALESGEFDAVIGNWPQPPEQLRTTTLFEDEVVCLMRKDHPLAGKPLTIKHYLDAEHVAPTPYSVGRRGVIDLHLARERLKRNVVVWIPYFHLAPYMLLESDLIFTCPRMLAEHYAQALPLAMARSPIDFPCMRFSLLWHDKSHLADDARWFREQLVNIARKHATPAIRPAPSVPMQIQEMNWMA